VTNLTTMFAHYFAKADEQFKTYTLHYCTIFDTSHVECSVFEMRYFPVRLCFLVLCPLICEAADPHKLTAVHGSSIAEAMYRRIRNQSKYDNRQKLPEYPAFHQIVNLLRQIRKLNDHLRQIRISKIEFVITLPEAPISTFR
jgi:hypothetical protein